MGAEDKADGQYTRYVINPNQPVSTNHIEAFRMTGIVCFFSTVEIESTGECGSMSFHVRCMVRILYAAIFIFPYDCRR